MIIKPDRGSQGKGIVLIQDVDAIDDQLASCVAQEYVDPFLIDGYKFDLRIYVLVTSVDPLRLYVHREGMARFCTEKYRKPARDNLTQMYGHLTNYSLNKTNAHFVPNEDADHTDTGSKRSLSSVMSAIRKQGVSLEVLQRKIDDIIRLTIAAIQPFLASQYHAAIRYEDGKSRCFEILGFDIMIDKQMNPKLIEVNSMPSLACDSPFDTELKCSVIQGALEIMQLNAKFKTEAQKYQRDISLSRINGDAKKPIPKLFDAKSESMIAAQTNWREIWPNVDNRESKSMVNMALEVAAKSPFGGVNETIASRARRQITRSRIVQQERKALKEAKEKKPPFLSSFPLEQPKQTKPKSACTPKKPILKKNNTIHDIFGNGVRIRAPEEAQRKRNVNRTTALQKLVPILNKWLKEEEQSVG